MPSKGGTWPALWMLGSNYQSIDWPACGEADILEHTGNNVNRVQATVHYPKDMQVMEILQLQTITAM